MAIIELGYTGNGDTTGSFSSGTSRGSKYSVGSAAGLVAYRAKMKLAASGSGASQIRIAVFDDDGTGGTPGTYLGSFWGVRILGTAETIDLYSPTPIQIPASGSIWCMISPTNSGTTLPRLATASVATAAGDMSGTTFDAEATSGFSASSTRDHAFWLYIDEDDQPDLAGDSKASPTVTNTSNRDILLARLGITASQKSKGLDKIMWCRANDAFASTKVRVVAYADDGDGGDPGTLLTQFEESAFGSNYGADGWWDILTCPSVVQLTACTNYIYLGIECDGSGSVSYMIHGAAAEEALGYRIDASVSGLPAWSDSSAPANLDPYEPRTSASSTQYMPVMAARFYDAPVSSGCLAGALLPCVIL